MAPRNQGKIQEIRKESMKNIMQAAFLLFSKQGFEATSIAQIAKQAGISKGLLYNYYQSKEELLEQLILDAFSQGDDLITHPRSDDPRIMLEDLFRWYFKELRERTDYWRLVTELTLKVDRFRFVRDITVEKMKAYVTFLEHLLTQIGIENPAGEAKIIMALFDGIGIQFVMMRENYPLDEYEHYLIHKYCKRET